MISDGTPATVRHSWRCDDSLEWRGSTYDSTLPSSDSRPMSRKRCPGRQLNDEERLFRMSDTPTPLGRPHFLLSPEGDIFGEDTLENREHVRRIHACVEACEGISTEELEGGIIQDMRRALDQVVPLLETRRDMFDSFERVLNSQEVSTQEKR